MPVYSPEFKEQIAKKMMPPNNQSVARISRETGVSEPTLYAWKKQFRDRGLVVPTNTTHPDNWDAKSKLAAVIQTAAMNEAESAAWCREHGLYKEQLSAWKHAFETVELTNTPSSRGELVAARKEAKRLQKELNRKDKALAETAALLALSKKASAIWGIDEGN